MTKTVASLCPWRSWIHRPHFSRVQMYMLEPIPKGSAPFLLRINDDVQWEKLLSVQPPVSKTILGEEIAADLVLHASRQGPFMNEDAHPAVWMCEGDTPSSEEIYAELPKLRDYCGLLVEYADDLERRRTKGEALVPKVTQRMKDACRYLDLKRDWLTELVDSSTVCPFCTHTIPSHALKCPECKEVVNRVKYDELRKNGGRVQQEVDVTA